MSASAMSTTRASSPCFWASFLVAHGERFGVAALAGIKNGQRLARLGGAPPAAAAAPRPAPPRSRRRSRRARLRCCGVVRATTLLSASMSSGVNGAFFGSNGWAVTNASSTSLVSAVRQDYHLRCASYPGLCRRGERASSAASPSRAALRLVYLDLVRPRQPGARPVEADEDHGRAHGCPCRRWRGARSASSVASARSLASVPFSTMTTGVCGAAPASSSLSRKCCAVRTPM